MKNQKFSLLYKNRPLFGFDLGHGSIKVVQIDTEAKKPKLLAYGTASFDPKAINEGVIVDYDTIGKAAHGLINEHLAGSLNTHRIAASLPVLHSFSRIVNLPLMNEKDVREAVRTEAGQYIPVPLNDLYLD